MAVGARSRAGSGASTPASLDGARRVRARDHRRRAARRAGRGGPRARRPPVAALLRRRPRRSRAAGRAHGPAALRCGRGCRSARARAGLAVADRERGGAAPHARRQLGPGDDPRLPRAAGGRGARPHAARRPLPARAARALPAPLRGGGRAAPPTCSSGCAPSTTRRSRTCGARGRTTGRRWPPRPRWAASCARSSAPASPTCSRRGATFLADEQGLGKTVQALAALEADDAYPGGRRLPGEPEAQLAARDRALAAAPLDHRGRRAPAATPPPADITILNYEIVHAHRARLALRRAARARARRVALRQEPARASARGRCGGSPRRCRRTRCGSRSPARR